MLIQRTRTRWAATQVIYTVWGCGNGGEDLHKGDGAGSTHANNLCNYGLFLSEEKRDFEKAELYYKRVLEVTPQREYALQLRRHATSL